MSWFEALILGIIQGLTEFLPVSSSGHLELGKALFGNTSLPADSLLFTVVVHAATSLSTVVIFHKDILQILKGLFSFKWNEETQFAFKIILSMIPAAIVGVLFEEQIDELFTGKIVMVGFMLLLTGLLLFLADKAKFTGKPVTFGNAFLIGIAQAIAILPGISRSGATISTSVLLGVDRARAARFSFLMVVPLILGKISKDLLEYFSTPAVAENSEMLDASTLPLVIGFIAAFITGLFACRWMIDLVRNSQLKYFSYYCFAVGIGAIIIGYMA
ncbi:undecaprenyl-diphosphate phosphatase [soil metagenome]